MSTRDKCRDRMHLLNDVGAGEGERLGKGYHNGYAGLMFGALQSVGWSSGFETGPVARDVGPWGGPRCRTYCTSRSLGWGPKAAPPARCHSVAGFGASSRCWCAIRPTNRR
ncbi:unnamed protein product [Ixodes persulcatus]